MDETQIEIYAHLNFQEFLLEILHANMFNSQPELFEKFRNEVLDRLTYRATFSEDADTEQVMLVQQKGIEVAESFFNKVVERINSFPKT